MAEMRRILKKALLLGLCLALLAGSALANEVADISLEGYDCMYYGCTLPDGRVILSGCNGKPGNYMDRKARLVCLNPDTTVSWEYLHPQEGSDRFTNVTLLKDGTLCVYFENAPYQTPEEEKLMFFTQEGQPTGRVIPLNLEEGIDYTALASGLLELKHKGGGSEGYMSLTDWDGNLLFRTDGEAPVRTVMDRDIIEEEDGLVMLGCESTGNAFTAAAKIVKIDFRGNTVWENTLPFLMEQNEGAGLFYGIRTGDGCYLARLYERGLNSGSPGSKSMDVLVKFTSGGRVLWMSDPIDPAQEYLFGTLAELNGRYVMQGEDINRFASLDYPIRYLWFDADGKMLGARDMYIQREDFARLAGSSGVNVYGSNAIFAVGDSLWADFTGETESNNHEKEMASNDNILIRVPEL